MVSRKSKFSPSVDEFVAGLGPPLKAEVEALRQVVASTAPGISEEVKWNAPSFYTGEHFATMRLNGKVLLQLILHLGAKKTALPPGAIDDPEGILEWLGPDRACVSFAVPGAVVTKAGALQAILRQWVQYVPAPVAG